MKNIVIDGIEYTPANTIGEHQEIVCVDNRGLMFVGMVDFSGTDEFVIIRNSRCIIRWGTTKHIAELADGPLGQTKLGATRDVFVKRRNIQFRYSVGGNWSE